MRLFLYGLVRVLLFVVIWGVCMQLGAGLIVSTLVAAVLTFAVSYLFLRNMRLGAAEDLSAAWEGRPGRRGRTEQADADAEESFTAGRFKE